MTALTHTTAPTLADDEVGAVTPARHEKEAA